MIFRSRVCAFQENGCESVQKNVKSLPVKDYNQLYVGEWDGDVQSVCLRDCRIDFELCYIFRFQRRTVSFTEKGRQSASTLSLPFRNSISILLHVTAKRSGSRSACHDYYWLAFQLIEMTI